MKERQPKIMEVFISLALLFLLGLFSGLYNALVAKPEKLRSILRKQGIGGPPPSFLLGNIKEIKNSQSKAVKDSSTADSHNCAAALFPFFQQWRNKYGEVFMFSLGNTQILHVNEPEIVREIATCTSLHLGKPSYQQRDRGPLLGQGILTSNGAVWTNNRKILAPELYMEKIKGMIGLITESVETLLNSWKSTIVAAEGGIGDIKIDEDIRSFSGDVISRACFGSNYTKGEEIFLKLRSLQEAMSKKSFSGIPGMRYIPTKHNRDAWALEKDVRNLILKVVSDRKESAAHEKDLLQMVIEGAYKNSNLSQEAMDNFIVDNCKNIYLAGYETTAVCAAWCLMLLAANPDWQARVRDEVFEICKGRTPDADMIHQMKQMTMVIHESLRLYPTVSVLSREALADMKFGDIHMPKGINVWCLVVTLHTDPENWGPDALKFKPERFGNGIKDACKLPHLYMPFGIGPRVCLGQNLAMVELKILISQLLSNFSFSISPNYIHSPALKLLIEPENGVNLLIKKL